MPRYMMVNMIIKLGVNISNNLPIKQFPTIIKHVIWLNQLAFDRSMIIRRVCDYTWLIIRYTQPYHSAIIKKEKKRMYRSAYINQLDYTRTRLLNHALIPLVGIDSGDKLSLFVLVDHK